MYLMMPSALGAFEKEGAEAAAVIPTQACLVQQVLSMEGKILKQELC